MQTIELSTRLPVPPDELWAQVRRPALLVYVAKGLLGFEPLEPRTFPEVWEAGAYRTGLWAFGWFPVGWQVIGIEYPPSPHGRLVLRDNGYGPLIKTWDHFIEIVPDDGGSHYTDRVHIDAGWLTKPVSAFAMFFYRHRQERLRALAAEDFASLPQGRQSS